MPSLNTISPDKLARLIGVPHGPALGDVRTDADFNADPRFVPGAVRRSPETVPEWASEWIHGVKPANRRRVVGENAT